MQQLIPGMSPSPHLVPPKPAPQTTIVNIEDATPVKQQQHSALTPDEVMTRVSGVLDESLVQSIDATYEFHITGSNGGNYYLDLKTGR